MTVGAQADPVGRDRLIIALAYALAWGAVLANRGVYWDDWTLVGQSPSAVLHQFVELGLPWVGVLQLAVLSLPLPGLIGHVITFGAYLLSALVLHALLRRIPGLSRMDALVAAVTFAVLPVNFARIALIDLVYGLSLLAFLAATWLLLRYLDDGRRWRRVAALVLFLGSFSTASLLVLYVVPIAIAAVILWRSGRWSARTILLHADFIVLPVAFWLLKSAFFAPSGAYLGYNALTLGGVAQVPRLLVSIPYQVLFEPLSRAATVAGLLGVVVGVGATVLLLRRSRADEGTGFLAAPLLALVGAVVLGLGVFAYLAVGRVPLIWDWSSRHQLLVPLGAGLLAAAVVRGVRGAGPVGPAFGVAVGLLLGISIVGDARTLVAYQLDWFKQTALIDAARTIPAVRTAHHIRIVDTATEFNALRRTYRFYEYTGMFSEALGDTRRLVAEDAGDPSGGDLGRLIDHPAYHIGQYTPSPVDLELDVSAGAESAGLLKTIQLVVLETIGSPSFEPEVSRLIDVRATPIGGSTPAP